MPILGVGGALTTGVSAALSYPLKSYCESSAVGEGGDSSAVAYDIYELARDAARDGNELPVGVGVVAGPLNADGGALDAVGRVGDLLTGGDNRGGGEAGVDEVGCGDCEGAGTTCGCGCDCEFGELTASASEEDGDVDKLETTAFGADVGDGKGTLGDAKLVGLSTSATSGSTRGSVTAF